MKQYFLKGFSLIEFIIYFALIALLLVIFSAIVVNLFLTKIKFNIVDEINQNGRLVLERILKEGGNALAINQPLSGGTANALSLAVVDGAKNPTIFDVLNGYLRIKQGASLPVELTSQVVFVEQFIVSNITKAGASGTFRIELSLQPRDTGSKKFYEAQRTFFSTANIRTK